MPKMATKAADNVFYKARIAAASWNDRLGSREGASEVTGIDRTRLANIELGTINPHPEEVLMLSDTYNAPELQNHFCSHLCPLGIGTISPIELEELERVTLQLISAMKSLQRIQELRHQTDDLLQCAAPVGEARDRPECYRLHLLRMRPSRGPRKGSRGHSQRGAGADYGHHQQALRLRRTEMARNSVCKTAILFVFGGLVYFGLEVLFRGHSHWTMFVLGGFLFLILGELNEGLLEWDTPLIWQGVLGSAIVTGAELVTGMILNVWLGLGVWDYSGMPFNYKGQICLPFSILWIFVSIAAVVLDDWLRYWLFGEEHPHYTLFRRGESR